MLKNWKKKLIVMLLIFTMTFGNFALVGKTYAASIFNGIFGDENVSDTGSSNVEFDAYFYDDQTENTVSMNSDVKNDSLKIAVKVNVKNNGYLKDAKILFGNGEKLNFEIVNSEEQEKITGVQSFENNELAFIQLDADSEVLVEYPINYASQKYVSSDSISKVCKIRFEGTYVTEDAEEISVSKDIDLKLSWTDEREVSVSSDVTKYIGYTVDGISGIILQTSVKVDNTTEEKTLPVKNSEVNLQVPNIDGVFPSTINVVASSTVGTNGNDNNISFSTDNWNYDKNSNNLVIKVDNEAKLISTQNENDILIDETAPLEEKYVNASGVDEYLVTYTYENVDIKERSISSNIQATYNMFGGTLLKSEKDVIYEVTEQIGDIVTYSVDSSTKSISKGYTYLNYNNEENKYEIEIDNTIIFNVSYKDIVESLYYKDNGNTYTSKEGISYEQNDIYYKTLKISKENFEEMLSEEGYINICGENGDILFTINKDTELTKDGNYELTLDNSIKSLQIVTSNPMNNGNLVISAEKAYSNVSYDKENYKNFDRITINTVGKAKYIYLDEMADCGNSNLEIQLADTKTNAELEIGQDTLSTLAMNNNVEMKIEFNNENIESDVYGNSEFTIKMPEYVETVEVTDASMVYGEGLELSNVEAYEQDGNIYLKINTEGEQNALSSGIISKGTNIVLNTNIKVDLFAPATDGVFELSYTNSEATNYETLEATFGYTEEKITYSAPLGVVSVNSTSGYNTTGTTLTSVNQGKVTDEILIYSDAKIATMELTIMNNEPNPVSNVSILGRVPHKGIKDIMTGEDLGTTTSVKMISGIVAEDSNNEKFIVYYSENGEATNDLNNNSNGWTNNPESFENIKSYLLVPENSEYVMDSATKLRFTYKYEIPSNLEHNEEIYGIFATYYTNNTKVADVNEISEADLIGLVTGEGPQFDVETIINKNSINEFEDLAITTKVTNKGKATAKNVVVEIPIPEYMSYSDVETDSDDIRWTNDGKNVVFTLNELKVGDSISIKLIVNANAVYSSNDEKLTTNVYATVTATDLGTIIKTDEKSVTINQAELQVTLDSNVYETVIDDETEIKLYVRVKNLKSEAVNDVTVTMQLDDNFEYEGAYILGYAEDGRTVLEVGEGSYNSSNKTVTWKIDKINSLQVMSLRLYLKAKNVEGNETKSISTLMATAKASTTESYSSGAINFTIGKPNLVVKQTTKTTNTYVKEGETINYQFTIKNEGSVKAKSVILTDNIPNGLVAKSVSYEIDGIVTNKAISNKDNITIGTAIDVGDTVTVNIEATATTLKGSQELSVTNNATVTSDNAEAVTSNDITHIIEASERKATAVGESSNGIASSNTTETLSSLSKTYKITGVAWLDKNNDGMRDESETLMKGITATLVDSDGGIIKQSTITNSKGEYTFIGVSNGNYIIIFDYDTVLYTVTIYQKENVTSNVNSDVITTKIEQDGVLRNGAVTDVISVADGSVSNVDIGLIEAMKFDLNLDLGISKITVQNASGTNTESYDNAKLTKTEISAKQMAGSVVYIEYTFKVKNEGEIAGYANKIVDYLPTDMNFNSGMNTEWYTGSDGNLYTTTLSNTEIQPGETKTFTLVLSRTMTDENTGTVSNTAEIVEDYNIYGVSDLDSTPGNKAQGEDDFARADSYLSVRTGEVFVYVSVIITTILLVGIAAFIVVLKLKYKLTKGGV